MKYIKLTHGHYTIVDDEDFEELNKYNWHLSSKGYAIRAKRNEDGKQKTVLMHREILKTDPLKFIDHKNRDPLDNRKENLRECDFSENQANKPASRHNTSGFKGVFFNKRNRKFVSIIIFRKKRYYLGGFLTATEASEAYNKKANELHGEFANSSLFEEDGVKNNHIPPTPIEPKTRTRLNNKSGYIVVSFLKKRNIFVASICTRKRINSKQQKKHIGYYLTDVEAAKAYNDEAVKLFGENAKINEIDSSKTIKTISSPFKILRKNSTSGFRGVRFKKSYCKFEAYLTLNYKFISFGLFDRAIDAAKAYNQAVVKYKGDKAIFNIIPE